MAHDSRVSISIVRSCTNDDWFPVRTFAGLEEVLHSFSTEFSILWVCCHLVSKERTDWEKLWVLLNSCCHGNGTLEQKHTWWWWVVMTRNLFNLWIKSLQLLSRAKPGPSTDERIKSGSARGPKKIPELEDFLSQRDYSGAIALLEVISFSD